MRRFLLLVSILVLIIAPAGASPEVANALLASTAKIIVNNVALCSGSFIARDTVLTAAHCVDGVIKSIQVFDVSGKVDTATVIRADNSLDLALLKTSDRDVRVTTVFCCVAIGSDVAASGFPEGVRMVSFGKVEAIEIIVMKDEKWGFGSVEYIFSNYTSAGGLSGGGVYEVPSGDLVGVHVRTMYSEGEGRPTTKLWGMAVSARTIQKFLGGQK